MMRVLFYFIFLLVFSFNLFSEDVIVIKAVGDTMLGSITPSPILPPRGGEEFVESISDYLKGADILICNLEGSFIKEGMKSSKCRDKIGRRSCFAFGMPTYLTNAFKRLGFNLVSLNNNHVMDYGAQGYEYTQKLLKELGMNYATRDSYTAIEVRNKRIALVSFGFNGGKYTIIDVEGAKSVVSDLKKRYDLVIVSFHGGAEGRNALNVKNEVEYFLGENRGNVVKFARGVVDAGADLVIGHGPHVLRAVELYKGKIIAYSLGNFLTYGNINIQGYSGISGILEVSLKGDGELVKAKLIPVVQISRGIPVYDEKKRAIKLINELGKSDFPQTYYKFEE
ncbi:MAG: CapA family protein [Brevinematia bacterium]